MDSRMAILDSAEHHLRVSGFHGFSFRKVAVDVGIKSASVHYYFPTKADLVVAVAHRYREGFVTKLDRAISNSFGKDCRWKVLTAAFRHALAKKDLMCLCGLLGAEIDGIPQIVQAEIKAFFEEITTWLLSDCEVEKKQPNMSRSHAFAFIAMLEGAMILARTLQDIAVFDQIVGNYQNSNSTRYQD